MEPNFIIHPNRLTPIYWDHKQETTPLALGISNKRYREIGRKLEDILCPVDESDKFQRVSEQMEACINAAQNEQERIWIAYHLGSAKAKSDIHHGLDKFKELLGGKE